MLRILLLGSLVASAAGQTATITTTSTLVLVPALVRAPENGTVPTLRASDFLVTDNGVPQKVSLEATAHQPLAILVVLQTGGTAVEQFANWSRIDTLMNNLIDGHPNTTSLLTFDSQPETLFDFAPGAADLKEAFLHPEPGDRGAAILDAVNAGIDALAQQPPSQRRVIVLISQMHDEGSHVKAEEVIRRLGESNVTIECLGFSPEQAWLKDQFTKQRHENPPYTISPDLPPLLHTFNLDQPLRQAMHALRENTTAAIAQMSGGQSFSFATKAEFEHKMYELGNDFVATYMLSFRPSSTQPGLHVLHVEVLEHADFSVSARSSYWADADAVR